MGNTTIEGTTGSQLTRSQWAISFALVTSLFFTWGFAYGLLDVLNAHFQVVFGITKTETTLLQFAYFGAYFFFAPFASQLMRKWGYKKGIHLGLSLYSIGAVFFWPSAKFKAYGGFVASTFVIGCGLSTLEVAANSYIAVLGTPRYAAARLNFSQGFQGVASFAGPMIASRYFFRGENATSLTNVQWVYLAVSGLGVVLNLLFHFTELPEITEEALSAEIHDVGIKADVGPFRKQYHCIFAFVAQFCYVGAQVAVASLVVFYLQGQGLGISAELASQMFSYCQITFTVGRFVGVVLLKWIDPAAMLTFYALACACFCIGVSQGAGVSGIVCLYFLFFFESISYPVIFTLGTQNLGKHTKRGSGLIVMGVGGGAAWPSAQAALADRVNTRWSYLVPQAGYWVMFFYGAGMMWLQTKQRGRFTLRSIDELAERRAAVATALPNPDLNPEKLPPGVEDVIYERQRDARRDSDEKESVEKAEKAV